MKEYRITQEGHEKLLKDLAEKKLCIP